MRTNSTFASLAACLSFVVACGSAQKPATTPEAPDPASETPAEPPAGAPATTGAEPASDATANAATESNAEPAPAGREIQYVVTSDGLEVRVEGVRFIANAKAVRAGNGWGVELDVAATTKDEETHSLLSPKNGPFSFAGSVDRGGERERFGDERDGSDEKLVKPGKPLKLTRRWPDKGSVKPLRAGETLILDVGLWGVGKSADERKPVKSFCRVKLTVVGGKGNVALNPPESATRE